MTVRRLRRAERDYPALLRQIPDPPPSLWLRGDADAALLDAPAVAIVGARACSGYGRSVARMLAREAAAAGVVVVSGLARGIDGEAHRGTLAAGGLTVAVLGCGIDRDSKLMRPVRSGHNDWHHDQPTVRVEQVSHSRNITSSTGAL